MEYERRLHTTEQSLSEATDANARLKNLVASIKSEKDLLVASEKRLTQEVDALLKERHSQNTLLTNLQTIQNNMKRAESEITSRLTAQIDGLQKDCDLLRRRLDDDAVRFRAQITLHETVTEEIRAEVSAERKSHQSTREDLVLCVVFI